MQIVVASFKARRAALIVASLFAASGLFLAAQRTSRYSPHEKAYYADPAVVEYVAPGFTITVVSAQIAFDGTIQR